MNMTSELFDRVRTTLFGGHKQNSFALLLKDRAKISAPLQGSPEEFSQVLYELTRGDLSGKSEVSYEVVPNGKKDILKFADGSLFRVVRTRGEVSGPMIVVTPHLPSMDDLLGSRRMQLGSLVSDSLAIADAFRRVANEYRREETSLAARKAVDEARIARESRIENILAAIEQARSGETVLVRGLRNIDALADLGFVPCLIDNPDNWIDAEDFPGMRYRHAKSGVELLLTGRERFRPIEEPDRLEFLFLVHRSDDDHAAFDRMLGKFSGTKQDGSPYTQREFHAGLLALVKYPEELKGRSEADLGLMADEVEHVIDRRQELDKGILPYEAVFRKDTQALLEHIRRHRTPPGEVRKALDYFEYTGMIDAAYKAALHERIEAASGPVTAAAPGLADVLYDKRVKEIVTEVLRKIPRGHLTSAAITIAMRPYVGELGLGKLVRIRERILQLKEMVMSQAESRNHD